ncbi:hypothetical protein BpHYR1_011718 [Brachionus plicatilis]|uniref:Uncharacterized protein n=1 Tax=Brachionus plicatilis TaxID=10195 RepID=A0A3M7SK32_BRAPC|nr:hypothetical protein BpHYR1_011718 [Brachionus plicatilis]
MGFESSKKAIHRQNQDVLIVLDFLAKLWCFRHFLFDLNFKNSDKNQSSLKNVSYVLCVEKKKILISITLKTTNSTQVILAMQKFTEKKASSFISYSSFAQMNHRAGMEQKFHKTKCILRILCNTKFNSINF